ncbi:MAG TPA: sigma-70 family RNA polymerase sigma factor [Polyangiales bacterium]
MTAVNESSRSLVSTQRADDEMLLISLRAGDERAFLTLVRAHHRAFVRVARGYVKREDVAEEVAQEAWQGFLESLSRFEPERASVKTWLFRILVNCARARSRKERRTTPLSSLAPESDDGGPVVPRERFSPEGEVWAGHWCSAPRKFVLDDPAVSRETRELLVAAIEALPENQREVIVLRDVEGFSAEDVCAALSLSEPNQRVLLHRARAKVRAYLERALGEET